MTVEKKKFRVKANQQEDEETNRKINRNDEIKSMGEIANIKWDELMNKINVSMYTWVNIVRYAIFLGWRVLVGVNIKRLIDALLADRSLHYKRDCSK